MVLESLFSPCPRVVEMNLWDGGALPVVRISLPFLSSLPDMKHKYKALVWKHSRFPKEQYLIFESGCFLPDLCDSSMVHLCHLWFWLCERELASIHMETTGTFYRVLYSFCLQINKLIHTYPAKAPCLTNLFGELLLCITLSCEQVCT